MTLRRLWTRVWRWREVRSYRRLWLVLVELHRTGEKIARGRMSREDADERVAGGVLLLDDAYREIPAELRGFVAP